MARSSRALAHLQIELRRWLNLPEFAALIVAIPIIHFVVVGSYTLAYVLGFGANIGNFFDSSSIFSVSISEVGLVYILFGVLYFASNTVFKARVFPVHAGLRLMWSGWILSIITIILFIVTVSNGHPVFVFIPMSISSLFIAQSISGGRIVIAGAKFVLSYFALSGFTLGLSMGYNERRLDLSDMEKIICGDYYVLRKPGDLFIAQSRKDGTKWLIDGDCKPKMKIPKTRLHFFVELKRQIGRDFNAILGVK